MGDFGDSFYFRTPVAGIVWERFPTTLILGGMALAFALALSIPLGVIAAIRPNSWIDRLTLTIAVVGQAMPSLLVRPAADHPVRPDACAGCRSPAATPGCIW